MKLWHKAKDGGPESTVTGYWLVELKSLFSVALLRLDNGSRSSYHSHAFNSLSWVLKGRLREQPLWSEDLIHSPSVLPIVTRRDTYHRVFSEGTTWVLTFRGRWAKTWEEYDPFTGEIVTLGNGRRIVRKAK